MSTSSEIVSEFIGSYIYQAANALYLFECCITLSQEVDTIWCRRWSLMTWVYALTRYATALLCIWTIIPVGSLEVCVCFCKASEYIDYILVLTQYICYALFSALRAYALLDGTPKMLISGTIFLLNLVPFASNLYEYATSIVFMDTDVFSLATRIAVIAGDALVLVVTWSQTARLYLEARKLKIKAPLALMLIHDGTCYFLILLLMNVMQVLQSHIRVLSAAQIGGRFLTVLTPIIICRFILNLRLVQPAGCSWLSNNQSVSLRFVGNMGQTRQFGKDENGEEGNDEPQLDQHLTWGVNFVMPEMPAAAIDEAYVSGNPGNNHTLNIQSGPV